MVAQGDLVKVFYKEKIIEGLLMPEDNSEFTFLKMSSGYNIGLKTSSVKKIELLKKKFSLPK
ncbi:MAG: hypothetical protein KKF65_02575 [Nanoarchaeota archaeon]|nr:hypothetical protein [Nanoarchaeota archaeon]